MSMTMLIICPVSGGLSFASFLIGRCKPTRSVQRITYAIAVILPFAAVTSGVLGYRAGVDTEDKLQLAHDQGTEAIERVDSAKAQITEIRTPRRMELETKRTLAARLKAYAGQKYDMRVFRERDSLELATAIQATMAEAGWVYTNVYPRYAIGYAETRDDGVWLMSGMAETTRTSDARTALHGALDEAGLYDDSGS